MVIVRSTAMLTRTFARRLANFAAAAARRTFAERVPRPSHYSASCSSLSPLASSLTQSLSRTPRRAFSVSVSRKILIWADHDGAKLHPSVAAVLTAAKAIDNEAEITVLVTGDSSHVADIVNQAASLPVASIVTVTDPLFAKQMPENLSMLVAKMITKENYNYLLVATTSNGKNILGRIGALIDSQPVTDVVEVKGADMFVRPIYAGNALETVQLLEPVKLLSVRPTNFAKTSKSTGTVKSVEYSDKGIEPLNKSEWVKEELTVSERPDLSTARVVVSGGRGMKSGDNFKLLTELADTVNGAVGASRAAVDAGMVPNEYQVGQTGKVVAPDLYIAVGISGAIQHLAGMKDSKVIVAINKDKEAPIYQVADYGLVDDLFKVVPELTKQIKAAK